jgi:hypothetical protein
VASAKLSADQDRGEIAIREHPLLDRHLVAEVFGLELPLVHVYGPEWAKAIPTR